jgi:hypothetical protein
MEKISPYFTQDKESGLFVPVPDPKTTYLQHPFGSPNTERPIQHSGVVSQTNDGTRIRVDDDTGIAFWPSYASGLDDLLMRAITRGHMANGGMTPVLMPMLSTIVSKRQAMVGTWTTTVTGRKSPVKATLDLMALADGSSMGPIEFVQNIIGALDVDNRGAIIAQVPIHLIAFDDWDKYGMTAEPMDERGSQGRMRKSRKLYVLRMEQEDFQQFRGVWTVDGLHCFPTGNPEYPYWIRKHRGGKEGDAWVLIHKDYGFQLLQRSGGKSMHYAGFGQSGTWRFSPYAVKHMAISRMDWEMLIAQPPRGIVWASGLDTATQLRDQLTIYRQQLEEEEILLYPSVFFGGTTGENSKVALIPWVEPPHGYTPPEWMDEVVSNLASSFHMNETHLRLKLGEGAMTQSGVAESIEAETSISWMRQQIETVWNHIAPPRVIVTVVWQSDRTIRYMIESFREYSLAVSRLQKQSPGAEFQQEQVFTRDEIRAMMTQTIGLEIPDVEGEEETSTARSTGDDLAQSSQGDYFSGRGHGLIMLSELPAEEWTAGRVVYRTDQLSAAVITGYSGNGPWVWIMQGERELLTHARDCYTVNSPESEGIGGEPVNFQIEGEPAPAPPDDEEELVIDYDKLAREAEEEMAEVGGFDMNDPNWDWDPVERVWYNVITGEVMDPQQMVIIRDRYADGTADKYTDYTEEDKKGDPGLSLLGLLLVGAISLGTYELLMREAVSRSMLAQWMLGYGDIPAEGEDRRAWERQVVDEWSFLHALVNRIFGGEMSNPQIRANARLYFSGTIGEYELARMTGYQMALPAYPGDCSSECCANDRCFILYTYINDDDDGERIEAAWMRTAAESCPTCLRRAACPPIIFYPQTNEYENWDCWIS